MGGQGGAGVGKARGGRRAGAAVLGRVVCGDGRAPRAAGRAPHTVPRTQPAAHLPRAVHEAVAAGAAATSHLRLAGSAPA